MSLVIIKVNRNEHTHSIYSDGQQNVGNSILNTTGLKIAKHNFNGVSLLIGTAGTSCLGRYFRLHIVDAIGKTDILGHLDDIDLVSEELSDLFTNLRNEYMAKLGTDNKDNGFDASVVLSINGHLFSIDTAGEDVVNYHCFAQEDYDFVVCGGDRTAALCLLDSEIDPVQVITTLSKFNSTINENVRCFKDVPYAYVAMETLYTIK